MAYDQIMVTDSIDLKYSLLKRNAQWAVHWEWKTLTVPVALLRDVALWWMYETMRNSDTRDMFIDDAGFFLIHLNDEANPPGWYHYRKSSYVTEEDARIKIEAKYGGEVEIPVKAIVSNQTVSTW